MAILRCFSNVHSRPIKLYSFIHLSESVPQTPLAHHYFFRSAAPAAAVGGQGKGGAKRIRRTTQTEICHRTHNNILNNSQEYG